VQVGEGHFDARVHVGSRDELGMIADHTNQMIASLDRQTKEIQITQDVTIYSLVSLAGTRDNETGEHIQRTQHYVRILAEALNELFHYNMEKKSIDLLFKSAPLHDIGKVGVPDAILMKPGPLSDEEWVIMRKHTVYGHDALRVAEERLGTSSFLRIAREIAYTHHEKWDGSGYPRGLKGEEISLSGCLMAVADVYDALISWRPYKKPFSHEVARNLILEGKGRHFSPNVVEAFEARIEQFRSVSNRFKDVPRN
jgi:response regulator RpfG family c-di-GMP phosphodiesterase